MAPWGRFYSSAQKWASYLSNSNAAATTAGALRAVSSILLWALQKYLGRILLWIWSRYQFAKSDFYWETISYNLSEFQLWFAQSWTETNKWGPGQETLQNVGRALNWPYQSALYTVCPIVLRLCLKNPDQWRNRYKNLRSFYFNLSPPTYQVWSQSVYMRQYKSVLQYRTRSDNKVSGLRFENREKGVQKK